MPLHSLLQSWWRSSWSEQTSSARRSACISREFALGGKSRRKSGSCCLYPGTSSAVGSGRRDGRLIINQQMEGDMKTMDDSDRKILRGMERRAFLRVGLLGASAAALS